MSIELVIVAVFSYLVGRYEEKIFKKIFKKKEEK